MKKTGRRTSGQKCKITLEDQEKLTLVGKEMTLGIGEYTNGLKKIWGNLKNVGDVAILVNESTNGQALTTDTREIQITGCDYAHPVTATLTTQGILRLKRMEKK